MNRSYKTAVCIFFITLLLAFAVACNKATIHEIHRVNKQVSDDFNGAINAAQTLQAQGAIDNEDAAAVATFVSQGIDAHKLLTSQLRALPANASLATAVPYLNQFLATLDSNKQALHIKSSKAQAIVDNAVVAITSVVNTLLATVQGLQPPQKADGTLPLTVGVVLAAWNALSKIILQWKADGTLSDQQLDDAADAEDDETKQKLQAMLKH